nr:MAG: hypothetical protein DIU66_02495 [Bacillota bacterium]
MHRERSHRLKGPPSELLKPTSGVAGNGRHFAVIPMSPYDFSFKTGWYREKPSPLWCEGFLIFDYNFFQEGE